MNNWIEKKKQQQKKQVTRLFSLNGAIANNKIFIFGPHICMNCCNKKK